MGDSKYVRGFEILPILLALKVNQGREKEDHVATFVHDRGAAIGAADFARKLVDAGFLRGFIPPEVMMAVREVDVCLVKDGTPLERGSC